MSVEASNLKLVLAVDAIHPPLTGIGRYAWELASGLAKHSEIGAIRFFSMGRWVDDPACMRANGTSAQVGHGGFDLRRVLAGQRLTVEAYLRLSPWWFAHRLKGFGDHLYHSPNYFIPPVKGPAVATVHDLSIYKYPEAHPDARRRYFEYEFPRSLKRASHLITDSEATRQEVIEFCNWPAERISAVALGVDPRFAPRTEAELRPVLERHGLTAGGYSLCVSTVEPRKKIDRLLSAYEGLPATLRRRFPLVLVGGRGWLSGGVHAAIERGTEQGWVRYLGYVPEAELPMLYAGARTFCFLSVYEGFGLPVLEAMAAGVPVLIANRTSLPEVAGEAGWQVEPDDIDMVRAGLVRVLEDDEWRASARCAGLKRAARMSWDRCVQETIAVYRRVLA